MSITINKLTKEEADKIRLIDENQFGDIKGKEALPSNLTNDISAFANSDGGDLYIGITDKERRWIGFKDIEEANSRLQVFEEFFPLGLDFHYEFLSCDYPEYSGLVLHVQINKTQSILKASNNVAYIRRGAQSLPLNTPDKLKRLELSKGVLSFENELVNVPKEIIVDSSVINKFITEVVPVTTPEAWLKKQNLLRGEKPTVAGVLMFAEEPQAALPKYCGIKIYRYKGRESDRDLLSGDPITVEGDLYTQIKNAVIIASSITEEIPKYGGKEFETIKYPHETLHEILANAVLHRDYSIKDDIHIRIFDDRIEVQSPGRLPANITPKNILEERFARNGALVRILNKFPNPPNKDVGEGLNTAFVKMEELGLRPPVIKELESSVLVIIRHELLASAEELIFQYLHKNVSIKNAKAREITHTTSDFRIKGVFKRLEEAGKIEKVPGTKTVNTAWRLKRD